MKPTIAFTALALAALLLPLPAADATGSTTTVDLLDLCLPQHPDCAAPSADCGLRVPTGASVGVRIQATRDGRPLAYTPVVSEPSGARGLTGADGTARLSLQAPGPITLRVDGAAPLTLDLRWTRLVPIVEHAPTQPIIGAPEAITVRILDEQGAPVPGAVVHMRAPDGSITSSPPADSDGRLAHPLVHAGARNDAVQLVNAEGCGLASTTPPTDLAFTWATSIEARDPPRLTVTERAWHTGAIPYTVRGGEPPNTVTWQPETDDIWRPTPLVLPEGNHIVRLRVSDAVGRASETLVPLRVDLTAPTVTTRFPPAPGSCVALEWTLSDAGSAIDDATLHLSTPSATLAHTFDGNTLRATLPDGIHRVTLRAGDRAGNAALHSWTLSCNATATETTPDWTKTAWQPCAPLVWTMTGPAPDPGTLRLSIGETPLDAPRPSAGRLEAIIPEGIHTLRLAFTNAQGVPHERSDIVKCDRTPPHVNTTVEGARSDDGRLVAAQRIDIVATDPGSGVALTRARWQGGAWQEPSHIMFTGEGERTLEIETVDLAGQTTRQTLTLPLDDVPPRIAAPAESPVGDLLTLQAIDTGSGVARLEARLAGVIVPVERSGASWTLSTTRLTPGALLVTAQDHAGNSAGARILITTPVTPPPPTRHPSEATTPSPAPPTTSVPRPEALPAPVAFTLQSIIVTPLKPELAQPIRISGLAQGVTHGTVTLVSPDGKLVPLGALDIAPDGTFTATGRAATPGTFAIRLEFETRDGDRATHDAGTITVAPASVTGAAPIAPTPAPALAGVALALSIAALLSRRR